MRVVFLSVVAASCLMLMCIRHAEAENVWDVLDAVEKRSWQCRGKIPQGEFCNPLDKTNVCCGTMGCYTVRGHDCNPEKEVCICRPMNRYPF